MRLIDADELSKAKFHPLPYTHIVPADLLKAQTEAYERGWNDAIDAIIENAETIEPQQWIPTTERLPKNDDWVVVTVLDESGDTPYRYTDFGWYLRAADCWIVGSEQRNDVIAWMPLPEPWKGEV